VVIKNEKTVDMNRNKFFEVLLYSTGVGLSLIVNLVTGDLEGFYQQNKTLIQILGGVLVALGLLISVLKESESISHQSKRPGVGTLSIFGTTIMSTLLSVFYGLIIGIAAYWGLFFIAKESTQQPEIANFLNGGGYLRVVPAITGALIGLRFKYVYGDEFTGVILGAFLGYAASFYFPESFSLPFLPAVVSHPSIVVSTLLAGLIGVFTGIFEEGYKLKIKEADISKEQKIEQWEDAVAILRNNGYEIYANDVQGNLFAYLERLASLDKDAKNSPDYREKMREIKQKMDADPSIAFLKLLWSEGNSKKNVPNPPYWVFNNKGDEVQKFTSTASLYRFATGLDSIRQLK
jgi:hypothetical protein